jgi:hypothetical protein
VSALEFMEGVAEIRKYGFGFRRSENARGGGPEQGVAQLKNAADWHN